MNFFKVISKDFPGVKRIKLWTKASQKTNRVGMSGSVLMKQVLRVMGKNTNSGSVRTLCVPPFQNVTSIEYSSLLWKRICASQKINSRIFVFNNSINYLFIHISLSLFIFKDSSIFQSVGKTYHLVKSIVSPSKTLRP